MNEKIKAALRAQGVLSGQLRVLARRGRGARSRPRAPSGVLRSSCAPRPPPLLPRRLPRGWPGPGPGRDRAGDPRLCVFPESQPPRCFRRRAPQISPGPARSSKSPANLGAPGAPLGHPLLSSSCPFAKPDPPGRPLAGAPPTH